MIRMGSVLFFSALGPFFGLVAFVAIFYFMKYFVNNNLESDDYFSFESISLVYLVGFVPAFIVGLVASVVVKATGFMPPRAVLFSSIIIGLLMSAPVLFFGYDIPPHSISERLKAAALIVSVNVGAATLSWLTWELARRGIGLVWKAPQSVKSNG